MKIIEYEEKYLDDVKDLLVELEEYILSIDDDELDQLHPEYRDKMALIDLEEVNENNGKCFLAIEDEKVIGYLHQEGFQVVTAEHFISNKASGRVMEKAGMVYEATLKSRVINKMGEREDVLVYISLK